MLETKESVKFAAVCKYEDEQDRHNTLYPERLSRVCALSGTLIWYLIEERKVDANAALGFRNTQDMNLPLAQVRLYFTWNKAIVDLRLEYASLLSIDGGFVMITITLTQQLKEEYAFGYESRDIAEQRQK